MPFGIRAFSGRMQAGVKDYNPDTPHVSLDSCPWDADRTSLIVSIAVSPEAPREREFFCPGGEAKSAKNADLQAKEIGGILPPRRNPKAWSLMSVPGAPPKPESVRQAESGDWRP